MWFSNRVLLYMEGASGYSQLDLGVSTCSFILGKGGFNWLTFSNHCLSLRDVRAETQAATSKQEPE